MYKEIKNNSRDGMKLRAFLEFEWRNIDGVDIEYEIRHNRPLLEFYKEVDEGKYDEEIRIRKVCE